MTVLRLWLIIGALLAGALFVACGGDSDEGSPDELALEDYFRQTEGLAAAFAEGTEAASEQFKSSTVPSGEQAVQAALDFLSTSSSVTRTFVAGLSALVPPSVVENAHNDAFEAGTEMADAFDALTTQLTEAEDSEQALDAVEKEFKDEDAAVNQAYAQYQKACLDVQTIADAKGIHADLRCAN